MEPFKVHYSVPMPLGIIGDGVRDIAPGESKSAAPKENAPMPGKPDGVDISDAPITQRKEPEAKEKPGQAPSASPNRETASEPANPVNLTILHTNDLHGNLMPHRTLKKEEPVSGGEAYISTEIKKARSENQNVLLLDAGDMLMGTPISGEFKGKPMVEVMNREQYDAATIGNHDFDWGLDPLSHAIKNSEFPFLAANVVDKKTGEPLPNTKPYIIKQYPGVNVGIVGVTTNETPEITNASDVKEGLQFNDPAESLRQTIPRMKAEGADMVVVISHCGINQDKKMAADIPGINVIVGGHSHKETAKPVKVGDTLVVQAGFGGERLGKLDIKWDPYSKKIASYQGNLIAINRREIPADRDITDIIKKYKSVVDRDMKQVLQRTDSDLVRKSKEESSLGNYLTDLIRMRTKADIGLLNSGGLRADIFRGKITAGDLYKVIPFDNQLVTLKMQGKDIMRVLEQSAGNPEEILQVSGLKVLVDSSKPDGARVISVRTPDGKALDPYKEYRVATIDYLAKGGAHFSEFSKGAIESPGETMYTAMSDTIRHAHGGVSMRVEGRIEDVARRNALSDVDISDAFKENERM